MRVLIVAAAIAAFSTAAPAQQPSLRDAVARDYRDNLGALFDHFHRNPELSGREVQTAARMAQELRGLGYEVTTGVGGTGVVAVLRNGAGATVMMRADMDALPLREQSGLPNASTVRQADRIITIERGRITEQGTHETLMRQGGRYAQLYAKQMGLKPQGAGA